MNLTGGIRVVRDETPQDVNSFPGSVLDSLHDYAFLLISPAGLIRTWSEGAKHLFGYDSVEVLGKQFNLMFTPEDVAAGAPALELSSAADRSESNFDRWHVRKDGSRFWGTNTLHPVRNAAGTLVGFTKVTRDATESYSALQALSESEERLRLLMESVRGYAIFELDSTGRVTSWNSGAQEIFGYEKREIVGLNVTVLLSRGDDVAEAPEQQLLAVGALNNVASEHWLQRKDGTRFLSSITVSKLTHENGTASRGFVMVAHDISDRHQAQERLRRYAFYDHLTDLPNRALFDQYLRRAIALMKRHDKQRFAVFFIDVDHFKQVNDTFGHVVADTLLEVTARRLEECVRSEDVVARLGGDEFAILLNGIVSTNDVHDAAERIRHALEHPIPIDTYHVRITASIGITLGTAEHNEPQDILREADGAMYEAKRGGRARALMYDAATTVAHASVTDLKVELREAVARAQLRLAYQPIIDIRTNRVSSFEALVRWEHPTRGLLQPADFVTKAEISNFVVPIDRWMLREACRQLRVWDELIPDKSPSVNVNVSGTQFARADFLDDIRSTLRETGADPRRLRLEITESAFMERSQVSASVLADIRALGIELHIDDFGIGFSSLATLQHVPVSALKIDGSFVDDMKTRTGRELVRTIVALAHNLNLSAVAERVETVEQLERLSDFECDYAQGFYFAQPLDAAAAGDYLRSSA